MSIVPHNFANVVISQTSEDIVLKDGRVIPKGYINATEMCKANGKRWQNWERLNSTIEFLDEFNRTYSLMSIDVIIKVEGNTKYSGVWTHPAIGEKLFCWVKNKHVKQTEKDIQACLHYILGGEREVNTPCGAIDLLTSTQIIEVKDCIRWKEGVGQLLVFGTDYPNHEKRLHLFQVKDTAFLLKIKSYCSKLNILVTHEDIDDDNIKPVDAVAMANIRKAKHLPVKKED